MKSEAIVEKLVHIYKTVEYADYFFKELASMKSLKPSIDIERRRESIIHQHKLSMSRAACHDFFKVLEGLGLGRLEVIRQRHDGNSKFYWEYRAMRADDLAAEVVRAANAAPVSAKKHNNPSALHNSSTHKVYVFPLNSGGHIELSHDDLLRLVEFSRTVL